MTSSWWPVPARPSTWFSEEQLRASARYNRPIERAALARTIARFIGLGLSVAVSRSLLAEHGSWMVRLGAASAVTSLVLWAPATASDWWFDQKHEPEFGSRPLPRSRLAVGSLVSGLGIFLMVLVCAGVLYSLIETSSRWMFTAPLTLMLFAGAGTYLGHRAGMQARTLRPLQAEVDRVFRELLHPGAESSAEEQSVSFWEMDSELESGWNALTTLVNRRQAVAVTKELLEAPEDVQRLVVAHEIGHIRLGHLRQMVVLGLLQTIVIGFGACWVLQVDAFEEFQDPIGVPFVALTVWALAGSIGLVVSWVERAHERQADDVAFVLARPVGLESMRSLHATERADLQPSLVSRFFASHPAPAERLHRFVLSRSDG